MKKYNLRDLNDKGVSFTGSIWGSTSNPEWDSNGKKHYPLTSSFLEALCRTGIIKRTKGHLYYSDGDLYEFKDGYSEDHLCGHIRLHQVEILEAALNPNLEEPMEEDTSTVFMAIAIQDKNILKEETLVAPNKTAARDIFVRSLDPSIDISLVTVHIKPWMRG